MTQKTEITDVLRVAIAQLTPSIGDVQSSLAENARDGELGKLVATR